jgi:hypothetical protein
MDLYGHYKELYFKEVDRRAGLMGELSIPMALSTIQATVMFFFVSNFNMSLSTPLTVFFFLALALPVYYSITGIFYLIKSYHVLPHASVDYLVLALPTFQDEYFRNLIDYYIETGETEEVAKQKALKDFEEYTVNAYIRTTTHNSIINDARASHLFNGKRNLIYCLLALVLALVPYTIKCVPFQRKT